MEPRLNIKQLLIYSLLSEHSAALRTNDGSVALAINLLTYLLTYLICTPFSKPSPYPKRHLDRFGRFAQLTAESPYTLQ